jgi:hypothetical protein
MRPVLMCQARVKLIPVGYNKSVGKETPTTTVPPHQGVNHDQNTTS